MGGLRYESLSDMPAGMRSKVAAQIGAKEIREHGKYGVKGYQAGIHSKYHNQKTETRGIKFDSKKEARRYAVLMEAVKEGVIYDLRLQEDFTLREAYKTPEGERMAAIRYRADFTYYIDAEWFLEFREDFIFDDEDYNYWSKIARSRDKDRKVIEDVKSPATRTKEYRMKYKLMADMGYKIREV